MDEVSRRRFLLCATATTAGLTGCLGGGQTAAEGGGGTTDDGQPDATGESAGAGSGASSTGGDNTTTQSSSPDPDCALLDGEPTPFDVAGTPFVFAFDYVDSWQVEDPLSGPDGRVQGLTSPIVTVDGETEAANLSVMQSFEAVTKAEVDEVIAESVSGDYARGTVAHEQQFGGETVQVLGLSDTDIPFYQCWLPYGEAEARYHMVRLMLTTSILRVEDEEGTQPLCLAETVAGIETVRESIAPNPETTIGEV
ncbi:hypothetical protein [Haloarchaeobius amylolyticus]|uniref:hypothetical protein n=1 Tax=Haloarchaeobius amylolyticus TaxID=1198296 RepID=UPI00226F72C7|nr:hypothetical protein [Haloarchaeobius amylolyticus]